MSLDFIWITNLKKKTDFPIKAWPILTMVARRRPHPNLKLSSMCSLRNRWLWSLNFGTNFLKRARFQTCHGNWSSTSHATMWSSPKASFDGRHRRNRFAIHSHCTIRANHCPSWTIRFWHRVGQNQVLSRINKLKPCWKCSFVGYRNPCCPRRALVLWTRSNWRRQMTKSACYALYWTSAFQVS